MDENFRDERRWRLLPIVGKRIDHLQGKEKMELLRKAVFYSGKGRGKKDAKGGLKKRGGTTREGRGGLALGEQSGGLKPRRGGDCSSRNQKLGATENPETGDCH